MPKGNVLKSREPVRSYQNVSLTSSTRLHVQLNSWALCAPRKPRGNGLNSRDLTRFHQNCSSPNWIKVQTQPVDSWALCSTRTPKGYVLKSRELIQCYQSLPIPNEPNCMCNWTAKHFVLLGCPRGNVLNSHDLIQCYQNCTSQHWIKVQTQPVDSWALCSHWTPKDNNVLKSCETNLVLPKRVHTNWTKLHMQLNSWALCLCAPWTPKRQCPEFLLPNQILPKLYQSILTQGADADDSLALCSPWTPKGNILNSCEPMPAWKSFQGLEWKSLWGPEVESLQVTAWYSV